MSYLTGSSCGPTEVELAEIEKPFEFEGLPQRRARFKFIRFLRFPSFDPSASWTVYEADGGVWVRRIIVANVSQGIVVDTRRYGAEAPISPEVYELIENDLSALRLSYAIPEAGVTLDGERLGFHVWHFSQGEMRILQQKPEEELRAFYRKQILRLEEHLPASTVDLFKAHSL